MCFTSMYFIVIAVSTSHYPGAGLVYVVYPQAIGSLPFPPVWSVLFFLMMVFLGLDTQVNIYNAFQKRGRAISRV